MMLSMESAISEEGVKRIHAQSLEILNEVGIDFKTPKALEILEERGCEVNYRKNWASIPPELVEWAINKAPRIVRLRARDPQQDVLLDGSRSYHTTDSQGTRAADLENGKVRRSTGNDLKNMLRLADALDKVDIVNVTVAANDIPVHLRTIYHFALAFQNTSKHVRTGVLNSRQVPYLVELVKIVTGSARFQPIFSVVDCTISPLMHDGSMTEACIELAKLNVPIVVYPMPLAGGTAPVTLGGTLLMNNIEVLSGLVLFQCVNPGTPIIYGVGASQLDMQTGRYGGSSDGIGIGAALVNMSQYYDLPVNVHGMGTASDYIDVHYGFEATTRTMLGYMAGADEIYSVGLLGNAQTLSLEKMVLDNHLIRQMEAALTPINLDDAHIQANLIKRVGVGGEFLTQKETRAFTRQEYQPIWPPPGGKLIDMVKTEARELLQSHKPLLLPEDADKKIDDLLADADKTLQD